jgi:hypothetical protein
MPNEGSACVVFDAGAGTSAFRIKSYDMPKGAAKRITTNAEVA